ncbi:MAG TPA: energy transducer TonB [Xanthobacteraceae bacterium]
MIALTADDIADLRRWLLAGLVVACAYGGVAAAMMEWHDLISTSEPAGAIVVEFAPEQIAAPEQVASDAVPDRPIENVEKEERPVDATGEEELEQKVEPKPREEPPRDAVPMTTPAPPELSKVAALPAGPVQGTPTKPVDMKAMQTWVGAIAALLERKKRYPAAAHARREQGVAQVSFVLDRQGRLVESHIARSSGAADLDQEALALMHRAQPFPPRPPNGVQDEQVHLAVPIRFSLK